MGLLDKLNQWTPLTGTQNAGSVQTGHPVTPTKVGGGGQEPSFIERLSTIGGGNQYGNINFDANTLARLDALDPRKPDVSGTCSWQAWA